MLLSIYLLSWYKPDKIIYQIGLLSSPFTSVSVCFTYVNIHLIRPVDINQIILFITLHLYLLDLYMILVMIFLFIHLFYIRLFITFLRFISFYIWYWLCFSFLSAPLMMLNYTNLIIYHCFYGNIHAKIIVDINFISVLLDFNIGLFITILVRGDKNTGRFGIISLFIIKIRLFITIFDWWFGDK